MGLSTLSSSEKGIFFSSEAHVLINLFSLKFKFNKDESKKFLSLGYKDNYKTGFKNLELIKPATIIQIIANPNLSSNANFIDVKPIQTPTKVNIFGKIVLVFLLETNLNFLSVCCICYLLAISVSPAIVF